MAKSQHGQLSPGVVATIWIDKGFTSVEIVNRTYDGEPIWVRIDGIDPVPRGDDNYVVIGARSFDRLNRFNPIQVRLVAETRRDFSVEGAS